jgi:hypothetical protein
MYIRRRGGGGSVTSKDISVGDRSVSGDKPVDKTFGAKLQEGVGKLTHGLGTMIQGAVIASDKTLDYASESKNSRSSSKRERERKQEKREKEKKKKIARPLFDTRDSHFSEEQKKELSSILEKRFLEMEEDSEDEFEDITDEQDDDDGYFGITDPGLTAPTMTMGLRNSFGDFFGNSADAIASHSSDYKDDVKRKKRSIYI